MSDTTNNKKPKAKSMNQPLSDVRVLDLTSYIAGPYCTKLLADYGADVIKVEELGEGDPARRLSPFLNDEPDPEKSGLFFYLNTNKRGVTLNLKSETGKRIVKELVKYVDVLIESFSPGVTQSLGLGYDILKKIKPMLVMTSISDFGQTGPYRDFKGSELIYQGFGGPMYLRGTSDRAPLKVAGNVYQYQTGVLAAAATMFALLGVNARGHGDHVDVSGVRLALTGIDTKAMMMSAYQYGGHLYPREESGSGPHVCKDGYVGGFDGTAASITYFHGWARMMELDAKQREEWGRYATDKEKMAEFSEKFLRPWLLEHTQEEIVEKAQAAGLYATPYHTIKSLLNDAHYRERGFWADIEHPAMGKCTCPGAPFRIGKDSWQVRMPAPLLGQHNEEVYSDLGYTKNDLVQLKQAGVI